MLPGRKYTPNDVIRIVLRRKWLIVLPFAVGIIGAQFVARRLPHLYRSETLIQVVPQQIPETIVKSTVTAKLEERLPAISEQIMSRSRLELIITDYNLYPKERAHGVMEDVIAKMRADINGPSLVGKESFRLSYVNPDPQVAQKVTARLASLYIDENKRDRANQADGTNQFLETQLAESKRRLLESEKKLADYQRQFAGQLPSEQAANLQASANAQMQLQAVSESISRAGERRLLVERQLADAQTLPPTTAAPETSINAGPPTTAQQLQAARAKLEAYRLQYTEDHPDVRTLERTVRDLEARADEEAKRVSPQATTVSPAEAVRQKRIRDLKADLDVIDHQVAANQLEESSLKKRIAEYQAKVDAVPTRQAELVELTRDYETLRASYNNLLAKQEESKLASNLERREGGEQFRPLDPASLPEKPYNHLLRMGVAVGGAVMGLILGLALVGVLEYHDSSFKSEEEIVRILNLPVLALVPVLIEEQERKILRRKTLVGLSLAALVVIASSAAALAIWRMQ